MLGCAQGWTLTQPLGAEEVRVGTYATSMAVGCPAASAEAVPWRGVLCAAQGPVLSLELLGRGLAGRGPGPVAGVMLSSLPGPSVDWREVGTLPVLPCCVRPASPAPTHVAQTIKKFILPS